MRTAVITDTNSGISTEEAAEMGIRSIPMPVLIDGEIYLEGVDLESESFFTSLTEGKAVTTSQPSPGPGALGIGIHARPKQLAGLDSSSAEQQGSAQTKRIRNE